MGQNLLDLKRLNPIFKSDPVTEFTNAGVMVMYLDSQIEKGLRKTKSDLQASDPSVIQKLFGDIEKQGFEETQLWIVIKNIAVRYFYKIEDNINEPYASYFLFKEAPLYIQALARPALKLYKKSVVTISDDLPLSIRMTVNWHGENQREDILNSMADFLNAQEEVNDIIRDRSISLREALNNVLKSRGGTTQTSFSCCPTCGREIKSGQKFCNARKNNSKYKNKSHCLIKFNYWLEARLGIKTTKSRSRMRNQFCKEMVELTKEFDLDAWDKFKRRHPKLYEKRYKERWERERRPKERRPKR